MAPHDLPRQRGSARPDPWVGSIQGLCSGAFLRSPPRSITETPTISMLSLAFASSGLVVPTRTSTPTMSLSRRDLGSL